ncbi:hypothetical protein EV401DRAFT_1894504 [Pisolithus croceorrhizus]|nr:hypothetical protein EV401DRAFT_1894504 [Pisolithus croceorrhizus]
MVESTLASFTSDCVKTYGGRVAAFNETTSDVACHCDDRDTARLRKCTLSRDDSRDDCHDVLREETYWDQAMARLLCSCTRRGPAATSIGIGAWTAAAVLVHSPKLPNKTSAIGTLARWNDSVKSCMSNGINLISTGGNFKPSRWSSYRIILRGFGGMTVHVMHTRLQGFCFPLNYIRKATIRLLELGGVVLPSRPSHKKFEGFSHAATDEPHYLEDETPRDCAKLKSTTIPGSASRTGLQFYGGVELRGLYPDTDIAGFISRDCARKERCDKIQYRDHCVGQEVADYSTMHSSIFVAFFCFRPISFNFEGAEVRRPVISCRGTNKLRARINFLVMPGKEWTTPDQKAFLTEELLHYTGVSPKDYQPSTNLTDEQAAILANAIDKRKQQLRQWLRWHAGAGKNRAINRKTYQLVDKLLKPKACINKDWEIYAKVYYHSWVKPKIEGSMTMNISTLRQKIKDAFESESQEIQDEIFRMKEEQVVAASTSRDGGKEGVIDDEDDSIIDPKICQLNIEQCGPALQHILEYMATKTGWAFSVIMGGPDPLDAQGECIVTRRVVFFYGLHVGENKLGYNFAQAYSRFDGEVVQAYTEFLDDTFGRACEVSNPHRNADESESNNGEGGGDSEGDENDEDYPSNAATNTYTASVGAVATPSTGVATSSANVATPLVNRTPSNVATSLANVATPLVDGMSSNVASRLHACDSVPVPIAMPADATCITACDPTSTCVATPTATGQFQNPTSAYVTMPTLGSVARQSGDLVRACAPTRSAADPLLALGVPNLVAGLPMTYGDASRPILSTSDFDLSAAMTFDFPPLWIFETDVDAMMNGNTSLTAMGGPVQWSFGSAYVEPAPRNPSSDPMQVASPAATGAAAGRQKRRSIPSQRAQRDNAIGITGKENVGPLSVGRQKASLKRAAESNPGERKSRSNFHVYSLGIHIHVAGSLWSTSHHSRIPITRGSLPSSRMSYAFINVCYERCDMDVYDGVNQWPVDSRGKLTDDHRESVLSTTRLRHRLVAISSRNEQRCLQRDRPVDTREQDGATVSQKLPRNFILFAVGPIVVGTVAMWIVERKTKLIQKVGVVAVWRMGRGCNAAGGLSLLQYTWWKTRLTQLQHTDGKGTQCRQRADSRSKARAVATWRMGRGCNAAGELSLLQYRWWKTRLTLLQCNRWKGCQCAGMVAMRKVGRKARESRCNTIDRKGMRCCHHVAMRIAEVGTNALQHGLVGRGCSATSRMQLDCCNVGDKKEDPQSYCNAISGTEW